MKTKAWLIPVVGIATGLLVQSANAQARNGPRGKQWDGCIFDGIAMTPLGAEDAQTVLVMREEEKLARDVYRAMFDLWQAPVFANISESEQRHMDAIRRVILRYELEDPVVDDTEGVFTNPLFAERYADLIEAGSVSMVEAFKVGALIEEMDIKDLQEALAQTDRADLETVYGHLLRASRNHLRAFAARITAAGETYEAQYLTQEEFDEIAASPWEGGNGRRGACWRVRRANDAPQWGPPPRWQHRGGRRGW